MIVPYKQGICLKEKKQDYCNLRSPKGGIAQIASANLICHNLSLMHMVIKRRKETLNAEKKNKQVVTES